MTNYRLDNVRFTSVFTAGEKILKNQIVATDQLTFMTNLHG
jgi:hypothetical protein